MLGNLVVLNFHPQFVAKNSIDFESYAYIFRVEFLSDFMGHEQEERVLFPVRVLRFIPRPKSLFVSFFWSYEVIIEKCLIYLY